MSYSLKYQTTVRIGGSDTIVRYNVDQQLLPKDVEFIDRRGRRLSQLERSLSDAEYDGIVVLLDIAIRFGGHRPSDFQ